MYVTGSSRTLHEAWDNSVTPNHAVRTAIAVGTQMWRIPTVSCTYIYTQH